MKASELEGDELNKWVARAQGWNNDFNGSGLRGIFKKSDWWYQCHDSKRVAIVKSYSPTTNKAQAFELLELMAKAGESVIINQREGDLASCSVLLGGQWNWFDGKAKTLQGAISKIFVASVYGEEVSDDS